MKRINIYSILTALSLLGIFSCRHKQAVYANDPEANRNMIHILDSISKRNFDRDNPFSPEAQLPYQDAMITQFINNPSRSAIVEFMRGSTLLKLGREKEAVAEYERALRTPDIEKAPYYNEILNNYALANLRFGERTNCITNHMVESCVFPIKGTGIHQQKTGSRKAIQIYEAVLARNPADLASRWLLNIAYMTIGEYPQKVPPALLIPGLDKDSSGVPVKPFIDVAADLKLDTRNKAGGTIVDDFNNDGYLDIITSDLGLDGAMHYFLNNQNGGFTDVSEKSGLGAFKGGLNMIQADYNNDGLVDILVLRGAWQPGVFGKQPRSLLRNNGDGSFTDVTVASGLLSFHPTQTAVWRDFNNDGWLDLFIGNETNESIDPQPCELFMSRGDGTFSNVAVDAGCNIVAFVKGVHAADYNNDGYQDIIISTLNGHRILLKNTGEQDGMIHFQDVTHEAGLDKESVSTFPTWFWDYDNDGWPDIFVCGYQPDKSIAYTAAADALHLPHSSSLMYLYHNNHDGSFTNMSKQMGLDKPVFTMGCNFGDYDNDGWLDMYLGTGNPDFRSLVPNRLFKNMGGQKFTDITTAARVGNLQKGHAVAFADIDNDGDQDIYIEVGGAYNGDAYYNSLYLNPGQNTNNWIAFSLEGTSSNRSAIGARIKVSFTENGIKRSVYRDENSGGSFGSSPLRREIGIGQAKMIDAITITWPSGKLQTFTNIKPRQFLRIKEGSDAVQNIALQQLNFAKNHKEMVDCPPAN